MPDLENTIAELKEGIEYAYHRCHCGLAVTMENAIALLKAQEVQSAALEGPCLMPRELLLHTYGHGWEECHLIGDDEDPERYDLEECVWIYGHIMLKSGSSAHADSDHWRETYGKRYGARIWLGDAEPTEEQRKAVKWG